MKIRTRLLITSIILVAVGFYWLVDWIEKDVRLHYFITMEESMVDSSVLLSALLARQLESEQVAVNELFRAGFADAARRDFSAQIYDFTKTRMNVRVIVTDMEASFGASAEVKTFHAFCKKVIRQQNGRIELAPYLPKIIESDANLLGKNLSGFDSKIRTLDEGSAEVAFYLRRGDYYSVIGFDDAVYRLYKAIQSNSEMVPQYDQIVVDEFQDFNPLEVAFIDEISKRGKILIVGDDDQAVYDGRDASPNHLRALYQSSEFEKFELPFCSRCTKVVVDAVNNVIQSSQQAGHFKGRVAKRYECYWDDKAVDSRKFQKLIAATVTTRAVVPKYIGREIAQIDPLDIEESHEKGYPTATV